MAKKLIFIGAGAIGSYVGGWLSKEGHDVTLVDPWPDQVEKVRADGIAVHGPHDPFTERLKIFHIHEAALLDQDYDIGFVAMKSQDTRWATYFVDRFVGDHGYLVSAQNCFNDELIASIVGQQRAVGLIMSSISVALWEPGKVERGVAKGSSRGHNVFRAGEHDGSVTARTEELAEMMAPIDGSEATANLWGERWSKLSQNSMGNPLHGMTGLGASQVSSMPEGRKLAINLARECALVGLALGHDIAKYGGSTADQWANSDRGDTYEELDAAMTPESPGASAWRASLAQDVHKGRKTEIDHMNGYVIEKGRETGIATPVNAAVVDMIHAIDSGEIKPDPSNIATTLRNAGLG